MRRCFRTSASGARNRTLECGHVEIRRHLLGLNLYVWPQIVVCHPCRKFVAMPKLDVPYDPCPFVCKDCGTRGEIETAPKRRPAMLRLLVPRRLSSRPRTGGRRRFSPPLWTHTPRDR
jgi:hypothetical protein